MYAQSEGRKQGKSEERSKETKEKESQQGFEDGERVDCTIAFRLDIEYALHTASVSNLIWKKKSDHSSLLSSVTLLTLTHSHSFSFLLSSYDEGLKYALV